MAGRRSSAKTKLCAVVGNANGTQKITAWNMHNIKLKSGGELLVKNMLFC